MEKVRQVPELKLRRRDGAALLLFAAQVRVKASVGGKKKKVDATDCQTVFFFYQMADGVRRAAVCD